MQINNGWAVENFDGKRPYMAECILQVSIKYRWWFRPLLKAMFYGAYIGIVPSEKFLGRLVDAATYIQLERKKPVY